VQSPLEATAAENQIFYARDNNHSHNSRQQADKSTAEDRNHALGGKAEYEQY
jgi:hypothetical protein